MSINFTPHRYLNHIEELVRIFHAQYGSFPDEFIVPFYVMNDKRIVDSNRYKFTVDSFTRHGAKVTLEKEYGFNFYHGERWIARREFVYEEVLNKCEASVMPNTLNVLVSNTSGQALVDAIAEEVRFYKERFLVEPTSIHIPSSKNKTIKDFVSDDNIIDFKDRNGVEYRLEVIFNGNNTWYISGYFSDAYSLKLTIDNDKIERAWEHEKEKHYAKNT